MQLIHFTNKSSWKTVAGRLRTAEIVDITIGSVLCVLVAGVTAAVASGHPWQGIVPLAFSAVLLTVAGVFGARAGIAGTVLAALVFAIFMNRPIGHLGVSDDAERSNIAWMLLLGIGFSFLFAPRTSGLRRTKGSPPTQQL